MGDLINLNSESKIIEFTDRNEKIKQRTKELREEFELLKKQSKNEKKGKR